MQGRREILVDRDAGYAYVAVPKAARNSIREAIAARLGVNTPWDETLRPFLVHPSMARGLHGVVRWTVVRNPFDRLRSCWADKCTLPRRDLRSGLSFRKMEGWTFERFVLRVCALETREMDVHFVPQYELLRYRKVRIVDEIYRLDQLGSVWPRLMERWGLPELGISNRGPDVSVDWSDEMVEAVLSRFGDDFERFGFCAVPSNRLSRAKEVAGGCGETSGSAG